MSTKQRNTVVAEDLRKDRLVFSIATGLALIYLLSGLIAMIILSPRIPYADSWRFLAQSIELPFPRNILTADNGHWEVLPSLIRLADLRWFSAEQSFQIFFGIFFALLTVSVFIKKVNSSDLTRATKGVVMLFGVLGIFWLGNIRVLGHASEAIHAYLITACLAQGIVLLLSDESRPPKCFLASFAAGFLGFIASFSFGSGLACFVAFYSVLFILKSRWYLWLGVTLWLLLVLIVNLFWGSSGGVIVSPVAQINTLLGWLSAPLIYTLWPMLDPAIAVQIPVSFLQFFFVGLASSIEESIGPIMLGPWQFKIIVFGGLFLLLRETWLLRSRSVTIAVLGVAISWFSVAVGGLIAIGRHEYFLMNPEQVMAARYIIWSSLFWVGLVISIVSRKIDGVTRHMAALFIAFMLLPSQIWMAKLGVSTKSASELSALAVALGAHNSDTKMGENVAAEISYVLPVLKARDAGIFAWPEMGRIDDLSAQKKLVNMNAILIGSKVIKNSSGEAWLELTVLCKNCPSKNLLAFNQSGKKVGVLRKVFGSTHWVGWAKAKESGKLQFMAIK